MSDLSQINRRGFLSGIMAVVAAVAMPSDSMAQPKPKPRYLIMADYNHYNFTLRHLNNEKALHDMKAAGYNHLFMELPAELKKIRQKSPSMISWHMGDYMQKAGIDSEKNAALYGGGMKYLNQLLKIVNGIETKAAKQNIKVHYVDPMGQAELLRTVVFAKNGEELLRKRRAADPQMARNIRAAGSSGVVFVGSAHADNMKMLLPNSDIENLTGFSRVMKHLAAESKKSAKQAALTP